MDRAGGILGGRTGFIRVPVAALVIMGGSRIAGNSSDLLGIPVDPLTIWALTAFMAAVVVLGLRVVVPLAVLGIALEVGYGVYDPSSPYGSFVIVAIGVIAAGFIGFHFWRRN